MTSTVTFTRAIWMTSNRLRDFPRADCSSLFSVEVSGIGSVFYHGYLACCAVGRSSMGGVWGLSGEMLSEGDARLAKDNADNKPPQ